MSAQCRLQNLGAIRVMMNWTVSIQLFAAIQLMQKRALQVLQPKQADAGNEVAHVEYKGVLQVASITGFQVYLFHSSSPPYRIPPSSTNTNLLLVMAIYVTYP
jgi:hypothetical protein